MRVGIIGGGYVGLIWGTFLAVNNHKVTIVDNDNKKIDAYRKGRYDDFIHEKDLDHWMMLAGDKLNFDTRYEALKTCEALFICVGTPNDQEGNLDIGYVGAALGRVNEIDFVDVCNVVIRSTMPVGSSLRLFEKVNNQNIRLGLNPEFLREGQAFSDLNGKNQVVIAQHDCELDNLRKLYQTLYSDENLTLHLVDLPVAELIKSVNNSWHALKVTFANEIGRIARHVGSEPDDLMKVFFSDTKLNISTAYLRPGLPFGGSCLVKDTLGLASEFNSTFFKTILDTNDQHIDEIVRSADNVESVGIIGITFKKNTNDVRFSIAIEIARRLERNGKIVKCFDEIVDPMQFGLTRASLSDVENCDLVLELN
jgi:GDP-mannose 6-dehydrogenase